MQKSLKQYVLIVLKGMGMGAADIVPGVSGGTIAFITGIYEELIHSIKSINFAAIKPLFKLNISAFWRKINGYFLLALFTGILISVVSLSRIIEHVLTEYPILIWSFFFGLIIASAILVTKKMSGWNAGKIISLIVGVAVAYLITEITPAQTSTDLWFVFLAGALAICAMILPGISGSFILLLLGKYQFVLSAVNEFKTDVLLTVMAGAVVGLLTFANVLSWLLKRFHDLTIALLAGFMVGSLNKIWPWKVVEEKMVNDHGEIIPLVEKNVLPLQYEEATQHEAFLGYAILLGFAGMAVIFIVEWISNQKSHS